MRQIARPLAGILPSAVILAVAVAFGGPAARAGVIAGQYSLEAQVNETSVPAGGHFTALVGVQHSAGPYAAVQWRLEYDAAVVDAGPVSIDAQASGVCSLTSSDDDGARVLLGCADSGGAHITHSGTVFRVRFTCTGNGLASLTLGTTGPQASFVDTTLSPASGMQPVHVHNDAVTCGAGGGPGTPRPPEPAPGQEACTIAEVLTGESFLCADGKRVRMLQIDAPDPGQCGGGWAKAALANIFLPAGRQIVLDLDAKREGGGAVLAAPVARGTDGFDYNLSIVMVYVGLAKAADFGDGNTEYLEWARAAQTWAAAARWNMWAPGKTYNGGCD
jgi:endonuclease YncB( thermonuclease family)